MAFSIDIVDQEGNPALNAEATSDNIQCKIDKTAPTVTMTVVEVGGIHPGTEATPTYYAQDQSQVTVTITASENLVKDANNLKLNIDGVYLDINELSPSSSSQMNYSATKTLDVSDLGASAATGDNLTFTLTNVRDPAGNTVTTNGADGVTSTTDGSKIIFDTRAPTVQTATMSTSQGGTGYATTDDVITLTVDIPDGPIFAPTVQFAGDNNVYVNASTITGTSLGWSEGSSDATWSATITISAAIGESDYGWNKV